MKNNVVKFPGHKLHAGFCQTCRGSRAFLSLTTHCPMAPLDIVLESSVQMRVADYRDGEWRYYGYTAKEVFDA